MLYGTLRQNCDKGHQCDIEWGVKGVSVVPSGLLEQISARRRDYGARGGRRGGGRRGIVGGSWAKFRETVLSLVLFVENGRRFGWQTREVGSRKGSLKIAHGGGGWGGLLMECAEEAR